MQYFDLAEEQYSEVTKISDGAEGGDIEGIDEEAEA